MPHAILRGMSVALGVLAAIVPAHAQSTSPARTATQDSAGGVVTLAAARRNGAVVIDGRLTEPAWSAAPVGARFTQSYPQPGKPPVDPTEVRILYDDHALYVGVRLYDSHPDSIAAQLARRDASGIYSDWLHVIIDSYHDRRTAFRFSVNPVGVQKDVYTSDDGNEDLNWDAVWDVATRIDSLGWVAEYRIPFSQLRFATPDPGEAMTWGIQIMRDVARRNERDAFSPWTPQSPGFVSRFGDLTGLANIPAPRRLEILPYASSRATSAPGVAADPFHESLDTHQSIGADVRAGLPGGLTLSATVNPDFGQVEVDPAVVNLTAFETFFPEKRPFFLEASDVFSFGQVRRYNDYNSETFLYSRRIGRAPQGSPFAAGARFADTPDQTTIIGAAKVTGKHGPWTIGVQNALTAREEARIELANGDRTTTPVEPRTDYFAGRLRRDFRGGQTVVGGMVSGVARDMHDGVFDGLLTRDAQFGGIDFEHAWAKRRWYVSGFAAGSNVSGTPAMITRLQRAPQRYYQRPDASYLDVDQAANALHGYGGEVAVQRTGNWIGSVAVKTMSPGFEINDMGFQNRVDYTAASYLAGYQTSRANRFARQSSLIAYSNQTWNYGGTEIFNSSAVSGSATFNNFWGASAYAGFQPRYYSDRATRGGPLVRTPAGWTTQVGLSTDSRRAIVMEGSAYLQRNELGEQSWSTGLFADARPASNVHMTFGPRLASTFSHQQYVTAKPDANATSTYGMRYVFADLHQTTLSLDTRIEWTLTPRLSFQTYVQPLIAAPRYDAFKEFTTPRGFEYAIYGRDRGTIAENDTTHVVTVDPDGAGPSPSFSFSNPTFNLRSLRGNAVLRWEYRPGSAVYVVWQQLRSGFAAIDDFDAARDVGDIFRERPTNVFLVKATYWVGR